MECNLGLDSRDSSWWVDSIGDRITGLKVSLKLYHESDLQVGYQQSIAEAPMADDDFRVFLCRGRAVWVETVRALHVWRTVS